MYRSYRISISIPAYNESSLIGKTISGIPDFVDSIVVVDDASTDDTSTKVDAIKKLDKRVNIIKLEKNSGVGTAIMTAHEKGIGLGADILVVINGDNQMDPNYLSSLLDRLIDTKADYSKGNRFFHKKALQTMPRSRLIGNWIFSISGKIFTGYWHISDPLNGYTAILSSSYQKLNKNSLAKRYDFEVSMLMELAFNKFKVVDVPIPARYGTEISKIRPLKDSIKISYTLVKGYIRRQLGISDEITQKSKQ